MAQKAVLVTGGAGYIGSHTVIELLNADQQVVITTTSAMPLTKPSVVLKKSLENQLYFIREISSVRSLCWKFSADTKLAV
ncbi:unnamed protein product [Rhizopus stolonifer]